MKTRNLTIWMALGALAANGCSSDDGGTVVDPGSTPQATFSERGGVYHYVKAYDFDNSVPIFNGAHAIVIPEERGKTDAIDAANEPSRLHPELRDHKKYDAAATAGKSDWDIFASSWWAQSNDGIAKRWTGGETNRDVHTDLDNLSPVEKYDALFNPGQSKTVAEVEHWNADQRRKPEAERGEKHKHAPVKAIGPATAWELQNHGVYQSYSHPDNWWGHCNGWASYATAEAGSYPKRDIRVKVVEGELTECVGSLADAEGCMLVRMGDIEALFSELYFSDSATFSGRRCNSDPETAERDEFGRPVEAACRDLNPGSFHIALTGLLNKGAKHLGTQEQGKPPFIIDHNWDWEVWNFPLAEYKIDSTEEITAEKANELVGAQGSTYRFNSAAKKFMLVDMRYWMVSDGVSDSKMMLRADQRGIAPHEQSLRYILELNAAGEIIGGEWLKDGTFEWSLDDAKRAVHPDFFWMAVNHRGSGEGADDLGGTNDNPYVAYSKVKALLTCANDATTCAPPDVAPPPTTEGVCTDHCGGSTTEGGKTCYCDDQCTQYNDCCSDYQDACGGGSAPAANSCEGHCGSGDPVGEGSGKCYCDDACTGYGDCCGDYATVCSG